LFYCKPVDDVAVAVVVVVVVRLVDVFLDEIFIDGRFSTYWCCCYGELI
jgi:hypothetical protein